MVKNYMISIDNYPGVKIRLPEFMKIGHLHYSGNDLLFSGREILSAIQEKYTIETLPRKFLESVRLKQPVKFRGNELSMRNIGG
jgi:molybdenum cofactor biosynthesis enzyme MoaA